MPFFFCTSRGCTSPGHTGPTCPVLGPKGPLGLGSKSPALIGADQPVGGERLQSRGLKQKGTSSGSPEDAKQKKSSEECGRTRQNIRKAKKIVKLLRVDQSLKVEGFGTRHCRKLPPTIVCGTLRKVVRSMYAPGLSPVQELSIKTSSKVEGKPCSFCANLAETEHLVDYKRKRLLPQVIDEIHLEKFARAFSANVPAGWDKRKCPYVPNGHATKNHGRSTGGNWNSEEFSDEAALKLVYSAGKPRVVTLYSSHNVEVLTPLHNSLYNFLKRKEWLLVGSPTHERLRQLSSKTSGTEWLSFDYESATDNIKIAYVRRAIEILIDKGEDLSDDEVRCLRVVGQLSLDSTLAESGQPMGSPMSFPLLCLINKTVVDLALARLLTEGEIGIEEYAVHSCLINGDDLLTRSTSSGDLVEAIRLEGGQVGLKTNHEKTMRSRRYAEINSTVFVEENGIISMEKKTNVSALWMDAEVRDVVGYAWESTATARGFHRVVAQNASRLARQKIKTVGYVNPVAKSVLLRSAALRRALTSGPDVEVPDPCNIFPVEVEPENFALSHEDVYSSVTSEVTRLKQSDRWRALYKEKKSAARARKSVKTVEGAKSDRRSALAVLQRKQPTARAKTLTCLVDRWRQREFETLAAEEVAIPHAAETIYFDGESCSSFTQIKMALKAWKAKRVLYETKDGVKAIPPDPGDWDGVM